MSRSHDVVWNGPAVRRMTIPDVEFFGGSLVHSMFLTC